MPYKEGPLPQKDFFAPGVEDVYYSPNVYANGVQIALWQPPGTSGSPGGGFSVDLGAAAEPNLTPVTDLEKAEIARSAAGAFSADEIAVGLGGVGEVPQQGDPAATAPIASNVPGNNPYAKLCNLLNQFLNEANQGQWRETGSNPKIVACYSAAGRRITNDRGTPWCAGFATLALKLSGNPALATLSSRAYGRYGTEVPLNDRSKWRLNDIVVFARGPDTGHVGFYRGQTASGSVAILGGNQSDNLTQVGFRRGGMPIVAVRRGWTFTPEQDRPLTGAAPVSGRGGKVV